MLDYSKTFVHATNGEQKLVDKGTGLGSRQVVPSCWTDLAAEKMGPIRAALGKAAGK